MKNLLLLIGFIMLSMSAAYTQEKQLTIEDAVVGVWRQYYPEHIRGLAIRPDTKEFSKIRKNELVVESFDLKKAKVLISLDEINEILTNAKKDNCASFPFYEWIDKNTFRFYQSNNLVEIDIEKKILKKYIALDSSVEHYDYCEANSMIAYTMGNNLQITDENRNIKQVSNDRNLEIVYGQTVHRNEFGISKGTYWSPNGNYLAFYRKDESMVTDYPIVNSEARIAELKNIKYPMAGMTSEEVTLGIYNVKTENIIYIETGEPKDQYLTNIAWSPDEKHVYIAVLNREQNHMKLNQYDISNGKFVKTLFEEKHEKYVEPLHPMKFLPNDPNKFIWQTRKDGFSHLYLYDISGKEISQITKGNFEVQEIYAFTADGKDIFIKANKQTPIDFDIYRVNIASGATIRISKAEGVHNAIIAKDGSVIIDQYSSTTVPNEYIIWDNKGKMINKILTASNPLSEHNLGKMSIGTLKADDGETDLYYRMVLPPDFDPTKKYPVIVYVYGGPHAQLITNRWLGGAQGWDYYMAQQGYIMFTLDNRGSANRGLEFENIIYENIGLVELRDQMTGIEFLKQFKYVDIERIGVHGWSYGGFMATYMMLEEPEVFKVGVAGGPVTNWALYEIMYGERYMGHPAENASGYMNSNLLERVSKLQGRLMMIHGAEDPVVVWQHSLNFVQKCIENKVLIDYFVYPKHEHNVRGMDRVHLMRIVTRYFEDHL